ncbi:MAG: hypothetical protein ACFFDW_03450 [Candidatus Thorarchaeota archaeon]
MDYQDVITSEAKSIILISDDDIWKLLEDSNYTPIFIALRKGPMTVKELEEEYNKIVEKNIDKMSLDEKERTKLQAKFTRKDKTLYKYLDFLQAKGFIIQVGKRVKMGQTATETLYGRAAKAFMYVAEKKAELSPEDKNKSLKLMEKIISSELNLKGIKLDEFYSLYNEIYDEITNEKIRIYTKYSDEITKFTNNFTFEDMSKFIFVMEFILYAINAKSYEKKISGSFLK